MDGLAETLSIRTASEVLGRVREVPDACMVYTSWSRIIFPFFWEEFPLELINPNMVFFKLTFCNDRARSILLSFRLDRNC